jgi:predicted nucleic acid-binding protein
MTPVFVDTAQWVAFMRPEDNLNAKAVELAELLDQTPVVTSEPVLIEVLNFFSNLGPHYRRQAVAVSL